MSIKHKAQRGVVVASLLSASLLLSACIHDDEDSMNIVEVANENGSFTTLVGALEATGLDTVLSDESRDFTVFAPTDAAFAALGDISGLSTEQLTDILLYHVIADAEVDSTAAIAAAGTTVTTANSDDIGIALDGADLYINDSLVVIPDVDASNGVIHAIDTVLMPTEDNPASGTIADVATANGNFTTLVSALGSTGLASVLADANETYTVFAPTDTAFAKLGDISGLTNEQLTDILLYHVVVGREINGAAVTAIAGNTLEMGNGNDMAISQSSGLFANLSQISGPDVDASNGIIHVIDSVLMPPADPVVPTQNIVEIAVADGNFTKLVAALTTTGLDTTLSDPAADFTVFAPTDAAFAALGLTDPQLLALPELADILTKHVVAGSVDSVTAFTLNGVDVPTVNGETVSLSISPDQFTVDNAEVTTFDIQATNGIIHVIDAVIPLDP